MKLLILLLATILSAKTVWIVETDDLYGKCCIERGDIVILPYSINIDTPRGVEVIQCDNQQCVDYTVTKYKYMYRTKGIGVEVVK